MLPTTTFWDTPSSVSREETEALRTDMLRVAQPGDLAACQRQPNLTPGSGEDSRPGSCGGP